MILRILRASKKKVDKDSRGARCAGGTRISAGLISRFGRCFMFVTGKPHPSRQARSGVPVAHELAPVSSPDSVGALCLPLANRTRAAGETASPLQTPFPASLFPLKSLFTCRSGRDGPLLSSEKKVDKDSRGASPLRTPFLRPAANLLLFRAAGRLTRPFRPQTAGWRGNA